MSSRAPSGSVEHLLRDLAPQVLGPVMRRFYDFAAAEDAVQAALLSAALRWPREGLPDNPRAWLIQVASRRVIDHIRSEQARRRREELVVLDAAVAPSLSAYAETDAAHDDTLALLFLCCHPSLTRSSAIALTLRAVAGLTTCEIASAFFVPEATMAQRISRAKQTIKTSGIPIEMPTGGERKARLASVLHVLYLIFNEGYTSSGGAKLQRIELSAEAIRLARSLLALVPDDPEVEGLLALMLLTEARADARIGTDGMPIPLPNQDRSRWDQAKISEGAALLRTALTRGATGPYQLQAAIAALHDEAVRAEDTDWPQIFALYKLLQQIAPNPMIDLNLAIAAAMVHGPEHGLDRIARLDADSRVAGHHRLEAVRAHFFEMAGRATEAISSYELAAERTSSLPERNYLITQAARLRETTRSPHC